MQGNSKRVIFAYSYSILTLQLPAPWFLVWSLASRNAWLPQDYLVRSSRTRSALAKRCPSAPAKRRNLPSRLAVVRLHLRQALDDEFLPHFIRPFVFLPKIGAKRSLAEFRRSAQAAHGFQLVRSSFRLNVFGDYFINSLRVGRDKIGRAHV